MAVRVYIPSPYRQYTERATHVQADAAPLGDLLRQLAGRYPGLGERILDGQGHISGHLNVYVNQVESRSLDGEQTTVRDGDEVALIPAMAGGEAASATPRKLTQEQLERYSRQIRLAEVGLEGQRRLLDAKVLLIGAGGLGSPAAVYLAAAGVGTIGLVDGDRVDLSNLQRQILHFNHDVGRPKVQSGKRHIEDLNPDVRVVSFPTVLTSENAMDILAPFDVVVNGCDNFPTRYLVNDACVLLGKPMVDASILQWEGQATVFLPGRGCYRCLFPVPPPAGSVPSCAQAGIIGALAGHMGTLQAVEAVKVILGKGDLLSGRLITYDALAGEYQSLRWNRNPNCPVCGDQPTVAALIDYEGFCGVPGADHDDAHAEPPAKDASHDLSPQEAWDQVQAGALLVDVREPYEYGDVRIPGAELAPFGMMLQRGRTALDPTQTAVFVCRIGERSAVLVDLLRQEGFSHAYNLRGGLVAWENEGLPLERMGGQ